MADMICIEDIKALYGEYLLQAAKLESERKVGDGLFGMGTKPSDDPCHDEFAKKLEALIGEFASADPTSAEVREVLSYIYNMPAEHREPLSSYWMLNAVHGLTLGLAERLSPQDAEKLCKLYEKEIPRRKRLPVQKKVMSALKKIK